MPTYGLTIGGQAQDLAARKIVLERLTVSWRTGRQLVFSQQVRHDRADFQVQQPVLLTVDGAACFRGAIKSVAHVGEPGGERIEYTADGLRALSREVTACDAAGVPRLVWNAEPDDEDYDPARTGATVGGMIQELIDGHAGALQARGVIAGAGYVQAELDALTAVPSRVVLRERDFDRAIAEVLAHQPGFVFQVHPAEQRYRFQRIDDLPAVTVTVGGDDRVLSNLLVPDLRTRYTAVRIVGGEEVTPAVATVSDGGLTPEWDAQKEADWTIGQALAPADTDTGSITDYGPSTITDAAKSWSADRWQGGRVVVRNTGAGASQTLTVLSNTATTLTVQGTLAIAPDTYAVENGVSDHRPVYSRWRITDEAKRRIAPIIPGGQYAPLGWMIFQRTYKPVVCEKRTFRGGTGWFVRSAAFEWEAGRFVTAHPLARGRLDEPGAAEGPEDVLLVFAYRGANLVARYPAAGYAGTAWTRFGLERERVIHDEQFVSADDQPRYQAIAEALHGALADVVYAGRVPLAGLDWSLGHLGVRVNIAGVDRFGGAVTTGWEAIGALLGRVTFHIAADRTDLDLSTDTSDWSLPFAELRERRRTQDRLTDLEGQVRLLRRRIRQSPGAAAPDPDSIHRGVTVVESVAIPGGQPRTGNLVIQSADATIAIVNPLGEEGQVFDLAVGPHDHDEYILVDGTRPFTGEQSMGAHRLTGVANAADAADALPLGQAQTLFAAASHDHDDAYIAKATLEAAGDLIVASGAAEPTRLAVGTQCQILHVGAEDAIEWTSDYVRSIQDAAPDATARTGAIVLADDLREDGNQTIIVWDATEGEGPPTFKSTLAKHVSGLTEVNTAVRPNYGSDLDSHIYDLKFVTGSGVEPYFVGQDLTDVTIGFELHVLTKDWEAGVGERFNIKGLKDPVDDQDAATKKWVEDHFANWSIIDAKGDLIVGTADDTAARLPVGADNQVLVADSTKTGGIAWDGVPGHSHLNAQAQLLSHSGDQDLIVEGPDDNWKYLKGNSEAGSGLGWDYVRVQIKGVRWATAPVGAAYILASA